LGASTGIGVTHDIWAYYHNKKIDQEIKKLRKSQSSNTDYPNRVSVTINPIEQKLMLNYNLYIGR